MFILAKIFSYSIRDNSRIIFSSIATITIMFTLLGLLALTYRNLIGVFEKLFEVNHYTIVFKSDALESDRELILKSVKSIGGAKNITFYGNDEVKEQLKKSLAELEKDLNSIGNEFFPQTLEFSIEGDTESASKIIKNIEKNASVDAVLNSLNYNKSLQGFFEVVDIIGLTFIIFLLVSLYFILENSIRLMIYTQSKEIEIFILFGAKRSFVFKPLVLQTSLIAIISFLTSEIIVYSLYRFTVKSLQFSQTATKFSRLVEFYSPAEIFVSFASILTFSAIVCWLVFHKSMNNMSL